MSLSPRHARLANALTVAALGFLPASAHAQVTVAGSVFDSLVTQKDLGDATVMIVELGRTATTDKRGRFQFDSVPAGAYRITFFHAVLDSLELAAPQVPLAVSTSGRITVRLATPSPATAYARLCPAAREPGTGVAYGRVRDVDDGHPIGGAEVSAAWVEWLLGGGRPMTRHRSGATSRSSTSGAYVLCGLPLELAVDVRALALAHEAGPLPIQPGTQLLVRRDFALSLRDPAARSADPDSVRATVADSTAPRGHRLVERHHSRPRRSAVRRCIGRRARLDGHRVERRRRTLPGEGCPGGHARGAGAPIGFTSQVLLVDIATGGRLDTALVLDKRPQMLAAVSITGLSDRNDRNGFNDRRKKGIGTFISREEIEAWGPIDLVDLVTIKPTVHRTGYRDGERIEMRGVYSRHCSPSVFLDGMELTVGGTSMTDTNGLVRPAEVIGVEIYTGPMIPIKFDRSNLTGCGSIVMWTR